MASKWNDKKVIAHVKKRIVNKLELVGELVEGAAKLNCPVDTGNLRSSINHKVDKDELSVKIGTAVEYAPYIEFGTGEFAENGKGRKGGWFYVDENGKGHFTRGMKPHPFLRPALLENKKQIKRILAL